MAGNRHLPTLAGTEAGIVSAIAVYRPQPPSFVQDPSPKVTVTSEHILRGASIER